MAKRKRHCFFDRPTPIETCNDATIRETKVFAPLTDGQSLTVPPKKAGAAGVVVLALFRYPLTIARLVVSVVVSPVNLGIRGTKPHIFQKKLKLMPSLTYVNIPSSIAMVILVIGILATLNHSFPRSVHERMTLTVCGASSYQLLGVETSAGASCARSKTAAEDCLYLTAVAAADIGVRSRTIPDGGQPSEASAGNINKTCSHKHYVTSVVENTQGVFL